MTGKVEETVSARSWWRGSWPYLVVVVLATGSFGLLGGLVISGIVWWLERWRRVQIVVLWVLIPCLLVTFMVAKSTQKQRAHDVAMAIVRGDPVAEATTSKPLDSSAKPDTEPNYFDRFDSKRIVDPWAKNAGVTTAAGGRELRCTQWSPQTGQCSKVDVPPLGFTWSTALTEAQIAAQASPEWGGLVRASIDRGAAKLAAQWNAENNAAAARAADEQEWNRAASYFESNHPDIYYQHNAAIVQEMLEQLGGSGLSNEVMLARAYAAAKADSRWADNP